MSIEKTTVQRRKFVVKAGMTAEDVKKSKDATALQKKYANVFDSDGQKGFSQKEADLFNATTFSEKADGSVMFWTRQKDGTKKGTKMSGDINKMHYSFDGSIKPYYKIVKKRKDIVDKGFLDSGFYAVEGIPVTKIQQSKNATYCQKKYASAFDLNNNGKLEQDEADFFNATAFVRKANGTIVFHTRVEEKGIKSLFFYKCIEQSMKANNADKSKLNINKSDMHFVPYKKTHFEVNDYNIELGGVNFKSEVKDYSKIYSKGKYMNSVTMSADGTKIIYPDQKGGSVENFNQGGDNIEYTWGGGTSVSDGTYSPAGNGGWKHTSSPDNYYTIFKDINSATIKGTNESDRYQLENCNYSIVDNSRKDGKEDKVYLINCSNSTVLQNKEDATRMKMNDYDVLIEGNKKFNTTKIENDSKNVKYVRHFFKPNEFTGVKNHQVKYDKMQEDGIRYWR